MHWSKSELAALRRIRDGFLSGKAGNADYWASEELLDLYDRSFAQRIGWKWDGVINELEARGWQPRSRRIVDWGCGSGIASRAVLERWPQFQLARLFDRSGTAMRFASHRLKTLYPQMQITTGDGATLADIVTGDTLLVVSHVINELSGPALERLLQLASKAGEMIWVEAGAHAESRALSALRDRLLELNPDQRVVAPCTHQAKCGMLTAKNERHWCHHFAQPPAAIFQDGGWHQFSKELGIDLRSLPYSFLVTENRGAPAPLPDGLARTIGLPREFKGHDKVLVCDKTGVDELMIQKRDAPDLLKQIRKGPAAPVFRFETVAGKIIGGEHR